MCVDTFKNSRCLSQPRFRLCSVLTAIVFCLTAAQIAAAATYYVDPTGGSDTYPGTSTQPWKSMDMVRLSSAAGDTIRIVTVDAGACAAKWPEGRTYYAPGAAQFGITWTFDTSYRLGQFANGDFWVVAPAKITRITPVSTDVGGRIMNGSVVNPSPTVSLQGYDNTMPGIPYDAPLNVAFNVSAGSPLVLATGSSLVSTISVATAGSRPQLETAAVLTVLATAPADGSFRPAYSGTDKTVRHNKSELNYTLLANLAPVGATPALSTVERYFERPWIDHVPGWGARYTHPRQNLPDYGREIATEISVGALMLHLNYTPAQKETLMIRFVQLGIDLHGIVAGGGISNWINNGGHAEGRKWPILFAGLVLDDQTLKGIGAKSGDYLYQNGHGPQNMPADYIHFGEDDQTFYVAQLDVDVTNGPTWKPDSRDTCRKPYLVSDIGLPEWGIRHAGEPQFSNKCVLTYYREVVGGTFNGLALAALIMNAKPLWNHNAFFDYTDRYMAFTAPGGEMAGSWRAYSDFTEHMWDIYRSRYGPVWPASAGNDGLALLTIGDQQVTTGQTLTLTIGATNPAGSTLTYSASPLPSGATFSNQTFTWTPAADQVGSYQVTFTVNDGQTQNSQAITITVAAAPVPNSPPVLGAIGGKSVNENELLSFAISATDADAQDTLSYSASGLPNGAQLSGQTFSWTPDYTQAGGYQVTFLVSDGRDQDSETVTVSVANVNRAPTLNVVSDQSVDAGNALQFSLSAADADGDSLTYSATGLPQGANLSGQNFTWTPTSSQIGSYDVTFSVSDGTVADTKTATLVVVGAPTDTMAPVVARSAPEPDAIQVPLNSLVTLHVTDAGTGVDAASVVIQVNDQVVYQGDQAVYTNSYGRCSRSGSKNDYRYIYQPNAMFEFDQTVVVKVSATDLQGNAMNGSSYSYMTEMRSFGANKQVSKGTGTSGTSRPMTVRDTAGNLWAAWHAGAQGSRDIYVAKLTTSDESFQTPVRLTTDSQDQCNPDLAAGPDGKVYVVWQDNRRGNWDIFGSVCSNHQSFSKETRVSDSNDNEVNPAVAVDGQSPNRVYVAWQDGRNGNQDIYVAVSANAFVSTTVSRVTTDMADQTDPDITVCGQNPAYIVWTDMRNGQADLYGAASDAGLWTNVPIVTSASAQTDPAVAAEPDGSALHLVWVDNTQGDRDIYYASLAGLPGSPVTGRNIVDDSSGADQSAPAIASGENGRAFVCWQDSRHQGADTDLYFVELRSASAGTNILVGDNNTSSGQSEPAVGVNIYGHPYVVWSDDRDRHAQVYYAAGTFIQPEPLDYRLVVASAGATIGTDPSAISRVEDVSIVVPPGACPADIRMTISRVINPQTQSLECLGSYDFGPSSIDFALPVTVTIPYRFSNGKRHTLPYWYDTLTGVLSQQGITDVENVVISSNLNALRFKTTHFTAFYLVASDSASGDAGTSVVNGAGGCSMSPTAKGSPKELLIPYAAIAAIMIILRRRDKRRQKALDKIQE